jgi:hypothetical protein
MVIGNPTHDHVRSGLSLASSALGSDFPGIATGAQYGKGPISP